MALRIGDRTAVVYPDYTHNQARVALLTAKGGVLSVRSLGSLGSRDTSLVAAGAAPGSNAVVAWQTATGLGVARLVGTKWKIKSYPTARDRALATTGRAVVRDDGSLLLLGTRTSRILGSADF